MDDTELSEKFNNFTEKINDQIGKAMESSHGSKWPGMTYEQGVAAALSWVIGDEEIAPMDEDG